MAVYGEKTQKRNQQNTTLQVPSLGPFNLCPTVYKYYTINKIGSQNDSAPPFDVIKATDWVFYTGRICHV